MKDDQRWNQFNQQSPFEVQVINRQLKELSKVSVHQNFCSDNFLQVISKPSVADFILSKISCFQYILLNTFRRIRLKNWLYIVL